MTRLARTIIILGVLLLTACNPQAPANPPTATHVARSTDASTLLGVAWDDRSAFVTGLTGSERDVLSQLDGATVYQMDLRIADDLLELDGRQAVRYTNRTAEALAEIYFRLYPNLFGGLAEVQSVTVNDREVEPGYELLNSALRVPLSPPLESSRQTVIEMTFSVDVPAGGEGNYGMFGLQEGVLALAHFYPMIPVHDDEGWNVEIPSPQGDVVFADSSFYLVRVNAPTALTMVASGVESERRAVGGRQEVTYAAGPVRDFYLAASMDYVVVSGQLGETTISSYAPPELRAGAEAALRYTVEALRILGERLGAYPFTEFDVVATPTQAYGIEYPGITAMALRLYPPRDEYPPAYLESTIAHEVSHQWFYSTVGNDQLDEPWLDEALAQYITLLYWQDLYGVPGGEGFRDSLLERWARVDNADIPIGMPVQSYEGREYGAIVYGRGPLFIEALAQRMGQSVFDAFLRDYYVTHKWGIATADSFQELAEQHCRCDLGALFDEWVYEP
ncbi:MAG: hypothetical protein AMJ93_11025 [Anaerolineae bacterium SM23_84]|nr:MAG: hypothetical protein AMJ93_11025 [Anaerolineae bacterium SM23_84]